MTPRVKELLDSLTEMDASEVAEVRCGLQRMFGWDEDDGMAVREPANPEPPLLFGMLAREAPRTN